MLSQKIIATNWFKSCYVSAAITICFYALKLINWQLTIFFVALITVVGLIKSLNDLVVNSEICWVGVCVVNRKTIIDADTIELLKYALHNAWQRNTAEHVYVNVLYCYRCSYSIPLNNKAEFVVIMK